MDGLREERDKLLDALEHLVSSIEDGSPEYIGRAIDHTRSVIARKQGEQTMAGATEPSSAF